MKPSTRYWLRVESFGSPELTTESELSVLDMAKSITQFMLLNPLNQRMQFTIARTQENLVSRKSGKQASSAADEMAAIFDSMQRIADMTDEEADIELERLRQESNT